MMRKFCPKCGETTEELIGNLCAKCAPTTKKEYTFTIPTTAKLMLCKCRMVHIKNHWIRYPTLKEVIRAAIISASKLSKKQKIEIELPDGYALDRKISMPVKVIITDLFEPEPIEKEVNVIIVPQCCPVCSRKSGGYFESTIQLRGDNVESVTKLENYIKKRVDEAAKENDSIFITKTEKKSKMINIFLSSTKFSRKLAQEIKSKFNIIDSKDSYSHYGIDDGKEINRTTHLLRCK